MDKEVREGWTRRRGHSGQEGKDWQGDQLAAGNGCHWLYQRERIVGNLGMPRLPK